MKRRMIIPLLILFTVVAAGFTVYLFGTLNGPEVSGVTPHYLVYHGTASKIYLIESVTSYGNANETYTTPDGQVVDKGAPLFVIAMTLRNDYTTDNPAPPLPNQYQTSPADGTAYLYLTTKLYDKDGLLNSTDISVSDFSLPSVSGSGLVLSSGETATIKIYIETTHTDINKYEVNLYSLGDSIPSKNT